MGSSGTVECGGVIALDAGQDSLREDGWKTAGFGFP